MAYQLWYDPQHGRDKGTTEVDGESWALDGHRVPMPHTRDPAKIPFAEYDAEYVGESTGVSLTAEKVQTHSRAGAKRMVFSAPAKDDSHGNQDTHSSSVESESRASRTTNGPAPMAETINDKCGIQRGLMTTIHAMTAMRWRQ